jgi:hypothetical protein
MGKKYQKWPDPLNLEFLNNLSVQVLRDTFKELSQKMLVVLALLTLLTKLHFGRITFSLKIMQILYLRICEIFLSLF